MKHGAILFHDSARSYVTRMAKLVIQEFGWEILLHTSHSPDLATSDFHLFRSLLNKLRGTSFTDDAALEIWIDEFFASTSSNFFKSGIRMLPKRLNEMINLGGDYTID